MSSSKGGVTDEKRSALGGLGPKMGEGIVSSQTVKEDIEAWCVGS